MKKYIKLVRVHHWIKNLLIAFPLIFSGGLKNAENIASCIWGILIFSFISSFIYVVNDIRDAEKDRNHPVKCRRPVASGEISERNAWIFAAVLLILAALTVMVSGNYRADELCLCAAYIILNAAYSFGLKRVPIADIAVLVSGFIIRVAYGAAVIDVSVSDWLYLTVISAAFFFALGKRRNECGNGLDTRGVLKYYTKNFLDKNMYVFLALLNVFYALWCRDSSSEKSLMLTVPLVILICMRYSMDIEGDSDGDPVEVLVHDKPLMILCAVYGAILLAILYL